jgi:TnpA family transposase
MPRRYILTASERVLVAIPTDETALIRLYTLSEQDLSVIKQRRGDANRLGFAVLLCCLRYPGYALPAGEDPPHTFLTMISAQLGVEPEIWAEYAGREETRREHLSELRTLSIAESDFSNTL